MKISSLMRKLEKIKNQKGDIEVCVLENDFEFGKLKNIQTGYSDKKYQCFYDYEKGCQNIQSEHPDKDEVEVVCLSL